MSKNIRICLEYDGTRYDGWQKQENTDMTIQGKLEVLLKKMTGENIEIHGSGRTDAGVHAFGQIANFHTSTKMSVDEIMNYMNEYLPKDIAVVNVSEEAPRFHSRLNARKKIYCYRIWNSKVSNVFQHRFLYQLAEELDLEKMREAAEIMTGTHDFKGFCSNKRMKKSSVRTIEKISIEKIENEIQIRFTGDGFLYHMVRILTGTLIEIGMGKRKIETVLEIFEKKDRQLAGYTAPPNGLVLEKVEY
ncbi:tRNA pseudouridine(38-40) synthase TruA [Anaeromicropila populeti]|uniref:tRNA pseudouridine synthase A n=1 Tax=Anaeromicropila populeti TaxID=37658 RepID=A0A1I6JQE2_9FIRM|nr:tRNA pseudouridine(38-40) synthase TruA [Anaeromicropila populeti]SFR81174.1 tRNA pseudouridine38-40 synthase [Anaeromicropila populeti]